MTAALATHTPPSPIRLRPAPALEPPYDDELVEAHPYRPAPPIGPHDVELPLEWGHRTAGRASGRTASRQRTGRGARRTAARPGPAGWRVAANDLPLAIKRFLDLYVEVLNERRPLNLLLGHASESAFQTIKMGLLRRGTSWWPVGRTRRPAALRAVPRQPGGPALIQVHKVRTCEPREGVAEIAAVLRRGDELRAVALRLEREGSRWVCTALEFVG